MYSTYLLELKNIHNAFWWVTLNVNNFFLFTRKLHRAPLRGHQNYYNLSCGYQDFCTKCHSNPPVIQLHWSRAVLILKINWTKQLVSKNDTNWPSNISKTIHNCLIHYIMLDNKLMTVAGSPIKRMGLLSCCMSLCPAVVGQGVASLCSQANFPWNHNIFYCRICVYKDVMELCVVFTVDGAKLTGSPSSLFMC